MARKSRDEPAGVGDNSAEILGGEGRKQLQSLTERILRLLEDRDQVNEDLREVFNEAKDSGFDTKIMRRAIARKRKIDKNAAAYRSEEEQVDLYFASLWDLPLFERLNPHMAPAKAKGGKAKAESPAAKASRELGDRIKAEEAAEGQKQSDPSPTTSEGSQGPEWAEPKAEEVFA